MKYKVLTLTQPWATLVAIGAKKLETRSWATPYRGPLAIHAAKGLADMTETEFARLCNGAPFYGALLAEYGKPRQHWYGIPGIDVARIPRGAIIAVCKLTGCFATNGFSSALRLPPDEPERSFGNYAPGRYAWRLEDVRRLDTPIPLRGQLGLWDLALCDVCEQRPSVPGSYADLCQQCLEEAETASKNAGRLTDEPLAYVFPARGRLL